MRNVTLLSSTPSSRHTTTDAVLLAGIGRDGLVDRARGSEDDVLAPAPVSSVDHPRCTLRSSHSSAAQARPQYSPFP